MPSYHMRARVEGNFGPTEARTDAEIPTVDGHIWIPIDDENTWVYNFMYSYDPAQPLPRQQARVAETRLGRGDYLDEHYVSKYNRTNDYGIDRHDQKVQSMTGIPGINTQDFALQEGMGAIVDRTKEHVGTTDRAIIILRQILMESLDTLERGGQLKALDPSTYRNVRSIDRMVKKELDWRVETRNDFLARF
jgi:phthalate 4,5-dioxygenase